MSKHLHKPYVHQAFPKWKYHKDWTPEEVNKQKSRLMVVCRSPEIEAKLGKDWADSPADHGTVTHEHPVDYGLKDVLDAEDLLEEQEQAQHPPAPAPKKSRRHLVV